MAKWNSDEDFNQDIQELSVFSNSDYTDKEILSSAEEIKAKLQKLKRSRFDDDDENWNEIFSDDKDSNTICEDVIYCKPVRGRPLQNNIPVVNKAGGKASFLDNQKETSATIRKVHGLDFSNNVIESALQQVHKQKENDAPKRETFVMPNIRFNSLDSRSNSTTASNSSTSSPTFSSQQSLTKNNETNELVSSGKKPVNVAPPLFEIIKKKSKKRISQQEHAFPFVQSECVKDCNVKENFTLKSAKEQDQKSCINLLCDKDFPPL